MSHRKESAGEVGGQRGRGPRTRDGRSGDKEARGARRAEAGDVRERRRRSASCARRGGATDDGERESDTGRRPRRKEATGEDGRGERWAGSERLEEALAAEGVCVCVSCACRVCACVCRHAAAALSRAAHARRAHGRGPNRLGGPSCGVQQGIRHVQNLISYTNATSDAHVYRYFVLNVTPDAHMHGAAAMARRRAFWVGVRGGWAAGGGGGEESRGGEEKTGK